MGSEVPHNPLKGQICEVTCSSSAWIRDDFQCSACSQFSDSKREDMAAAPPDPAVIGTASDRGLRPLAFPRSKFDASLMPD